MGGAAYTQKINGLTPNADGTASFNPYQTDGFKKALDSALPNAPRNADGSLFNPFDIAGNKAREPKDAFSSLLPEGTNPFELSANGQLSGGGPKKPAHVFDADLADITLRAAGKLAPTSSLHDSFLTGTAGATPQSLSNPVAKAAKAMDLPEDFTLRVPKLPGAKK